MATNSPKKSQRVKPKSYSTCLLYNTAEAKSKLLGITLASCNPSVKPKIQDVESQGVEEFTAPEPLQLTVSDRMSCNYCDATFAHRLEQKRHYRSDWHRYNLKQRLKGKDKVTEEQFEDISGNISSLSGSDSDSDGDTDSDQQGRPGSGKKLTGSPRRLINSGNTSTDSESESGNQEDPARRLPKVYFKNKDGEILSIYRCVLCHKKSHPSNQDDLVTMATSIPDRMNWAVFMAAGGHFAGAVFNRNQMVAHKTFHRYVVRAKRGTAQGSRDSQGNAPKSAGASLRRYNEAALTQEIQELIASWSEYIQFCDRIFLRAPSFNRKIFFSGKAPPFSKDDERIRLIPFQTRRPTFNEVRRVYEMLASIECYGDESDMQDLVPISPPQIFNPETGQLTPRDENQLTPRQRKILNKKLGTSPLAKEDNTASGDQEDKSSADKDETKLSEAIETQESKSALPGHVLEEENMSSGTSTASDSELVETMATINLMEHKEFAYTKKPKRKKKSAKKRKNSLKCQTEPETNVMEEEMYHFKNSLYTACKVGDKEALKSLLAILFSPQIASTEVKGQEELGQGHINKNLGDSFKVLDQGQGSEENVEGSFKGATEIECKHLRNRDIAEELNEDIEVQGTEKTIDFQENAVDKTPVSIITVTQQSKSCAVNDFIRGELKSNVNETVKDDSNSVSASSKIDKVTDVETEKEISECPSFLLQEAMCNDSEKDTSEPNIVNENIADVNPSKENSTDADKPDIVNENIADVNPSKENSTDADKPDIVNENIADVNPSKENSTDADKPDIVNKNTVDVNPSKENSTNTGKPDTVNENTADVNQSKENSTDAGIDYSKSQRAVHSGKAELNLVTNSGMSGLIHMWTDYSPVVTPALLSEPFGDNGTTFLHVAAKEGHGKIITILMEAGANPALRDKSGLTPYMVSKDKATRNEFRRFMGKWPEKYDYEKAQIPAPLTEEMENERKKKEAERKKVLKKVKQEQQKVKREIEEKQKAEEKEKHRFLNLSDREKRALAAEKRLVSQLTSQGAEKPVLSRCFQCGSDMTGKVPFEYCDNKFCTPKCLQQHRKSQKKL